MDFQKTSGELEISLKLTKPFQGKNEIPQVRRVFLKSIAHKADNPLSLSDGIIVPHTLFTTLTDQQ